MFKAGEEVWIRGLYVGREKKCIVVDGNPDDGYRLRRLNGKCYMVKNRVREEDIFRTREEARAHNTLEKVMMIGEPEKKRSPLIEDRTDEIINWLTGGPTDL